MLVDFKSALKILEGFNLGFVNKQGIAPICKLYRALLEIENEYPSDLTEEECAKIEPKQNILKVLVYT